MKESAGNKGIALEILSGSKALLIEGDLHHPAVSKNLRIGVYCPALFQRVWPPAGPKFIVFGRVVGIQCSNGQRDASDDLW